MTFDTPFLEPTQYFTDDDDFLPRDFAEGILRKRALATDKDTDEIFHHAGPCWQGGGEKFVRTVARETFGNRIRRNQVNEVLAHVRSMTYQARSDMKSLHPAKLVVANGVVDLRTGQFSPGWDEPGTFTYLDVPYKRDATPTAFTSFLTEVLPPEDLLNIWELIGYCLYRGYPFQKAFMFLGEGANGKSTLLSALREFLGRGNVAAVTLQSLTDNQFSASSLEGKLANLAPDLDSEALGDTGTFKALSGGDMIEADQKYQEPIKFENAATLIFPANRMPTSPDGTFAYRRRWHYFKFPNEFEGDDAVPQEKLLREFRDEQPGILRHAMQGFQRLWERGGFESTSYMKSHDDVMERATEPAFEFVKDHIRQNGDGCLRIKDAYRQYKSWADAQELSVYNRDKFENVVEQVHDAPIGQDPQNGKYTVWDGLEMKGA